MRILTIFGIFLALSIKAEACSLSVATESLTGASLGHACVEISELRSDRTGPYRVLEIESTPTDAREEAHKETRVIRPSGQLVLVSKTIPGLGTLAVITLRTRNLSGIALDFLNGNSLPIEIDQNGNANPSRICVKQSGLNQVRGYSQSCP